MQGKISVSQYYPSSHVKSVIRYYTMKVNASNIVENRQICKYFLVLLLKSM